MNAYHNSQDTAYRDPQGAVPSGTQVTLSLLIEGGGPDLSCVLHLRQEDGDELRLPMDLAERSQGRRLFSVSAVISSVPSLCWYSFIISDGYGRELYYGNNSRRLGGEGCLCDRLPHPFQITVYTPCPVPAWYKNAVVYQIFPDRFARDPDWLDRQARADRGPDWLGPPRVIQQSWQDTPFYTRNSQGEVTRWSFFGGSLEGIRSRLLYLKSLGIGAIYLNPIFAARSNHKYDTADYFQIDPSFGTEEDFHRLARDARRLGIRLILDGVFNHTGADSKYFNRFGNYRQPGACQGADSPYHSWYRFTRFPDQYCCWWGVTDLPAVNKDDPSYQDFLFAAKDSVIRHWLKAGASGWRLDVADELPDTFIAEIKKAGRCQNPDGVLIGEVWEDASNKISYGKRRRYLLGEELDAAMNYPFRSLLLDYMRGAEPAENTVRGLLSLAENYPRENFYAAFNLIGSHDQPRILTLLGDPPQALEDWQKEAYRLPEDKYQLARQRLKLLSLLQFTLPGVPAVYYGDEAGCQGYEDPYNRGTYPWGKEDQELLAHYRMLAALRKQYPVLTDGDYRLSWEGEHVFICERYFSGGSQRLLVLINRHLFGEVSFELKLEKGIGYVLDLLRSQELRPRDGVMPVELPPLSAMVLDCREHSPQPRLPGRRAGVLCHISSLPSGRMDLHGETFIDFLADCGQKLWQILPLNPTGDQGGSPYSSTAVFAGNPDLMEPCRDFETVNTAAYEDFCRREAFWLDDFALYTVLKKKFAGLPWQSWPQPQRDRLDLDQCRQDHAQSLEAVRQQQFRFWTRWNAIKRYANDKGISIIGDLPLYTGLDSADTWAHPELFLLGDDGLPLAGAGVPADYFSENGQNWGNPLYDWDTMKKDGYAWWQQRISQAMKRFDYLRLDHFRGFSSFYAIPRGKTAKEGLWLPGPGKEFFDVLTEKLGPLPILAEDLGLLDSQARNLAALCGYPGMLVYQFSRDEMARLTEQEAAAKVFYTGTHDNQTLEGWRKENATQPRGSDAIIESLYKSSGAWVITPLQDLLGLGDESRMNVPGWAEGNWTWRAEPEQLTRELASKVRKWASDSGR
ncbi:4-alpha-glucanotransferase [Anaerovorax odorimutans]|uniref:4-alpha-glucanotransferase n=1 Tax=Anaerovorax odorimutans TaxID=109327 RepID=A0ABT1RSX0_9FIRM|nr:4-alpha-glucanotransferase [Anaerovorax odorimutans]MCQ4638313.1 4-alpha-glucanotransferase [Anaerovorax odorimutans]